MMQAPAWVNRFQGVPPPFPKWQPVPRPVYRVPGPMPWFPVPMQRAAVSYINGASGAGATTTLTINVPSGVANGNLLLLSFAFAGQSNFAITGGGWQRMISDTNISLWYRIASSEPASYTATWTLSGNVGATMTAFSGQDADPFLAYRILTTSAVASPHPTPALYFQSTDFMAVQFAKHQNVTGLAQPSGYTAGPVSGGTVNRMAYRSYTAQAGVPASSWTDPGGGHSFGSLAVAIRASGDTALSLKAHVGTNSPNAGHTSFGASLPGYYSVGDLITVFHYERAASSSTARTLSASGYTAVVAQQSNITTNSIFGIVYTRTATGSDALNPSVSVSLQNGRATVLIFSTGSTGTTPVVLGTPAGTNDVTSNTTQDIPAFTLSTYAETNFIIGGGALNTPANVTGFPGDGVDAGQGGNSTFAWGIISPAPNSGANPAATSWTSSAAALSVGFQLAIGRGGSGLLGAGAYAQSFVLG